VARTADQILASYYADATARLREMILHPYGKTDSARAFNQQRATQLIGQVRQIQRQLKQQAARVVGPAFTAAYRQGRTEANSQAVALGVLNPKDPSIKGSFALIDAGAVALVAADAAADLNAAADSLGANAERILRKTAQLELAESEINKVIAGGIIEGKPREAIRELKAELVKVNKGNLVTAGSMTFDAGYYAEMVIRTKTREAVTTARHQRFAQLDLDLVSIVGRVSDSFCTAFLGQVFSLSGNHPKYPAYDSLPGGGPPFHPNCSKGTRAFVEALANDAQTDVGEGIEDAQKLIGMNPTQAQRAYKDLQLRQQVAESYKRVTPLKGRKAE
jgi:hypothetical protein